MKGKLSIALIISTVLLAASVITVMATSVTPFTVDPWSSGDAPAEAALASSYTSVTYTFACKFDDWDSSTSFPWTETCYGNTITVTSDDGVYFNWTSTAPIEAVIVKGGNAANIFTYTSPGVMSDEGLYSPNNPNGRPAAISHVTFCWRSHPVVPEVPLGTIMLTASMLLALGVYFVLRKPKFSTL